MGVNWVTRQANGWMQRGAIFFAGDRATAWKGARSVLTTRWWLFLVAVLLIQALSLVIGRLAVVV